MGSPHAAAFTPASANGGGGGRNGGGGAYDGSRGGGRNGVGHNNNSNPNTLAGHSINITAGGVSSAGVYYPNPLAGSAVMYAAMPTAIVGGVPVPAARMHGGRGAGQLGVGPGGVQVIYSHTAVNHNAKPSASASSARDRDGSGHAAVAMMRNSPASAAMAASANGPIYAASGNGKGRGDPSHTALLAASPTVSIGGAALPMPMPRTGHTQLRGGAAAFTGASVGGRHYGGGHHQHHSNKAQQPRDVFENAGAAITPAEWAGGTPKVGPATPDVSPQQLQRIVEQLLSPATLTPATVPATTNSSPTADAATSPSSSAPSPSPGRGRGGSGARHDTTNFNSKNTPSLGALRRGEAAPSGAATPYEEVEALSSLIAHLPPHDAPQHQTAAVSPFPSPARSQRPSAASAILRSPMRGTTRPPSAAPQPQPLHTAAPSSFSSENATAATATVAGGRPPLAGERQGAHRHSPASYDASAPASLIEDSPHIQINAFAFVPTPEVSPCMVPSCAPRVAGKGMGMGDSRATLSSNASPILPPSTAVAPPPLPEGPDVNTSADTADALAPTGASTPPPSFASPPPLLKPNLASLLSSGTPAASTATPGRPVGPPPGSMAEKLLRGRNAEKGGAAQAEAAKAASPPPAPAANAKGAVSLPTTKAGIERFLKDGDAPETLRHIKILAFSSDYPAEIKALFELWAGNGIPPPDDAFGAYYWYVRKKIGRDLCMKHNGPGKAPGIGYGGCDYANRGQGQCRYHHQCLFCTKEDHGWFDEHKCGRYKTYQKELAKLRLSEDDIFELVEVYCK